jgi:hypothetical protein
LRKHQSDICRLPGHHTLHRGPTRPKILGELSLSWVSL